MKNLIILFFIAFMQQAVLAQPGTIDTRFGNNGIALSNNLSSQGWAIAIQKDKKILITGYGIYDTTDLGFINAGVLTTRFKENGTVDSSFGENGIVEPYGVNVNGSQARDIFALNDGKILVAEVYIEPIRNAYNSAVIKYNSDGTFDENFGNGGIVTTEISGYDIVNDMAVQSDGKIVLVGHSKFADFDNNWIIRYMPDGKLDENFGNKGILGVEINPLTTFTAVTIQPDNKILVGAGEIPGSFYIYTIRRFLENGTVDESFGENGRASFSFPKNNYYNQILDIGLQKEGQIIVGGNTGYPEASPALVRFTTKGKIDSSFGSNGYTILFTDKKRSEFYGFNGFISQEDERLLVGGYFRSDTEGVFAARLSKDGAPDSSYGENGVGKIVLPENSSSGRIALQNDGKLLIAGSFQSYNEGISQLQMMAARFNGDPTKTCPTIAQIKRWIRNHILHFEDANTNAAYYVIEKSTASNGAFVPVTKITANAATSNYSYTLPEVATQSTYRIKAVNKDNSITYSSPISSSDPAKAGVASFKVYPNPSKDRITVESSGMVQLRLQNSNGRVLLTQTVNGKGSMDISKLPVGVYYVVNTSNGESLKVVKE